MSDSTSAAVAPKDGNTSRKSGRARHTTKKGEAPASASRSMTRTSGGSAQCRSSNNSASGSRFARRSRNWQKLARSSSRSCARGTSGAESSACTKPAIAAGRVAMRRASAGESKTSPTARSSFASAAA